MGRITQLFDYLNRPSERFSLDFVKTSYTHLQISEMTKALRKKLRWFKVEDKDPKLEFKND